MRSLRRSAFLLLTCAGGLAPALGAQAAAPDTTPALPATAAALAALADSLCAWAARAAARGDSARVDWGTLLRPSVVALAIARCPARVGPPGAALRARGVVFRLAAFQVEGDSVGIGLEIERHDPGAAGFNWSRARYAGVVRRVAPGTWVFVRAPLASAISDGVTRIVPEPRAQHP